MKEKKEQIAEILEEILEEAYFLVNMKWIENKPSTKLQVFLEGDEGISIDKCAEISRALGSKIEELNLIKGAYTLEVSSPGIDMPIQNVRQYRKNIGRSLKINLRDGSTETGQLKQVASDHLVILKKTKTQKKTETGEEFSIELDDIQKANVLISFN